MPNIKVRNYHGNEVILQDVEEVTFDTEDGTAKLPFSYGTAMEDVPIPVNFSAGDQTISAVEGILVKSAIILKPENLTPNNIKRGVDVAGVVGDYIGNGETVYVALDMADGDMVITPPDGYLLSSVTVKKPDNMIPENIKHGETIGGVAGTFVGEGEEKTVDLYMADGDMMITPTDGKLLSSVTVKKPETLVHENIARGVTIAGIIGTHDGGGGAGGDAAMLASLIDRSVTDFTIPDSVTSIGAYAFYGCKNLTSITIPNSVTSIGMGAFQNCTSLTSITIPDSVTSIGTYAFQNCTSLTSVTIPDSVTILGTQILYGCTSLNDVTIGTGVREIPTNMCTNCTSLTSVTLHDNIYTIGQSAFSGCTALTSFTMPLATATIKSYAFSNCKSITSITLSNWANYIGSYAFQNCTNLTSAKFTATSTWKRYTSDSATSGTTISSSGLSNASTAATYLRSTYVSYVWKRT